MIGKVDKNCRNINQKRQYLSSLSLRVMMGYFKEGSKWITYFHFVFNITIHLPSGTAERHQKVFV